MLSSRSMRWWGFGWVALTSTLPACPKTNELTCPPCVPPPVGCVGAGPCGCGPYRCPDGGSGEEQARSCGTVSGDYGHYASPLGWGFDGSRCRHFSDCGCSHDCDHLFETATDCATSCAAGGHFGPDALSGDGGVDIFAKGMDCREVYLCAPSSWRWTWAALSVSPSRASAPAPAPR